MHEGLHSCLQDLHVEACTLLVDGSSYWSSKLSNSHHFYHSAQLKKWIGPGETVEEAAAASAPPTMSRVPSAGSVGSNAEK